MRTGPCRQHEEQEERWSHVAGSHDRLLGLADLVVMTGDAFAFVSGPAMVEEFTGIRIGVHQLGGSAIHARTSGLCAVEASSPGQALEHVDHLLGLLPAHADELPPRLADRPGPGPVDLRRVVPDRATSSYDVRRVAAGLADGGDVTELWPRWAPQLVCALARIEGRTVGFVANQSQALAGTLDIAASQKGARFVRFCDAFNIALVTLVDTPGFLPGKDLEWRGMIRHGAELAFAYAEATVPRVCVATQTGTSSSVGRPDTPDAGRSTRRTVPVDGSRASGGYVSTRTRVSPATIGSHQTQGPSSQ